VSYLDGNGWVLRAVSLAVRPGEFLVVTSRGHAARTALLEIGAGLLEPTTGRVRYRDKDIYALDADARLELRRSLAYVFAEGTLLSNLDVYDNLALALRYHGGFSEEEIEERILEEARALGVEHLLGAVPAALSLAEKLYLGIARSLVNRPRIILVAEPFGCLDSTEDPVIANLLWQLACRRGIAILASSTYDSAAVHVAARTLPLDADGALEEGLLPGGGASIGRRQEAQERAPGAQEEGP
jgi:ABC-type ATPase involved in cell division